MDFLIPNVIKKNIIQQKSFNKAMALKELYAPTFGDVKMPADGYCFYHCFNYVLINAAAGLTETAAMRLRQNIATQLRDDKKPLRARRLLKLGSGGYPDEEDFVVVVQVVGISFAIVQDGIRDVLVYWVRARTREADYAASFCC